MLNILNKNPNSLSPWGNGKGAFQLFTIFFYLLLSTSYSQEQFNNTYESEYIPTSKTVLLLEDTGYVTMGGAGIGGFEAVSINIFDIDGNLVDSKDYKKDNWNVYRGSENNLFSINNKYYLSGSVFCQNTTLTEDSTYIHL